MQSTVWPTTLQGFKSGKQTGTQQNDLVFFFQQILPSQKQQSGEKKILEETDEYLTSYS